MQSKLFAVGSSTAVLHRTSLLRGGGSLLRRRFHQHPSSHQQRSFPVALGGGSSSQYYVGASTAALLSLCSPWMTGRLQQKSSRCEASIAAAVPTTSQSKKNRLVVHVKGSTKWQEIKRKARKALRLFARVVKMAVALAPLALWIAVRRKASGTSSSDEQRKDAHKVALQQDGEDRTSSTTNPFVTAYLKFCLSGVEWSGAAVLKWMQWAGGRPDLFGHEFCQVFGRLQDHTTPHRLKVTEQRLKEAYGENWRDQVKLGELLGSGCIGQVYKGQVLKKKKRKSSDDDENEQDEWHDVAIKVLHPSIESTIDTDLEIMRFVASSSFVQQGGLEWLNAEGAVEEFAGLLQMQLDLRREAKNLEEFGKNFHNDQTVVFPKLIPEYPATQHVLVETYEEGIPVTQYAKKHSDDPALLSQLCTAGIRAVCHMIFRDNFLHGDLHPGNVLVNSKKQIVLLDVGMATQYTAEDHQIIVDILTAFIHKKGADAGRLLMKDSNRRRQCDGVDEEGYVKKIEALTIRASGTDYLMEHLGTYISYICQAAADHHVLMNQSFVSAALAIKVQEGIALALDPTVRIFRVANPIILRTETQRRMKRFGEQVFGKTLVGDMFGGKEIVGKMA